VKDEICRLRVVGDINIFGVRDYACASGSIQTRAARSITAGDVVKAVREKRAVAAGHCGRPAVAAEA